MLWLALLALGTLPVAAETAEPPVELEASLVDQSPVLRRWLQQSPDVLHIIRHTPAVPMRLRLGAVSTRRGSIAIEDIPLTTQLTLSSDYQWEQDTTYEYGVHLRYALMPRGDRVNIAPEIGYRNLNSPLGTSAGLSLGLTSSISLAPGAADLVLSYRLLNPASADESTLVSATAAYNLGTSIRLATQYSWQNTPWERDHRVGLFLEWAP